MRVLTWQVRDDVVGVSAEVTGVRAEVTGARAEVAGACCERQSTLMYMYMILLYAYSRPKVAKASAAVHTYLEVVNQCYWCFCHSTTSQFSSAC